MMPDAHEPAVRGGVLARFEHAGDLIGAVEAARAAGYDEPETFAPFHVPGLEPARAAPGRRIPAVSLLAAVAAAAFGYVLQWYASVVDYAFVVGGKPLHSAPAFALVTFELAIVAAVVAAVVAMLAGSGLPQPHHPAFDWPAFDRASSDAFFMRLGSADAAAAAALLREHGAVDVEELEP